MTLIPKFQPDDIVCEKHNYRGFCQQCFADMVRHPLEQKIAELEKKLAAAESPSSIEGGEKMFTKEDVQDAFDAGHDRGSYSAGGCDVMGVGYSPSFREWFEKEHPDKLSAKEIKDANESENWHPQDYSGKNAPSPALPIKEEEKHDAK